MDLRSVLDKLDDIKRQHFLAEVEDLMEKVGLRLADYTAAVRGITNDDERAAKIGEIARQYNFPGLFDPISGKFVNADGKFAWFGGYESEVRQLAAKGLIPDAAKTTAVLGMMGQDEKIAKPTSQTAEKLYQQIDKADELIKKALEAPVKEGLAESLLKEFGINTNLLEAITPEEHQLINKTRKDIEPLLKAGDGDAVEYKANYENYIRMRNELIAKINALIEAIKKMPAPKASAPAQGERSGSTATAKESAEYDNNKLLLELSLTPAGQKAGAKIYQPDWKGYLSPEQVQHNLNLLKKGYVKMDWTDHAGKMGKDWANMATFGLADKGAAFVSSLGDKNTSYEKELNKYRSADAAYNASPDALNLRTAANAVGVKIDPKNAIGNTTIGDIAGLVGPGIATTLFNVGSKVATKLGLNTAGKLVTGGATVAAGAEVATRIGEPQTPVRPQPAPGPKPSGRKDPKVLAFQNEILKTDKKAFPRYGNDGIMGPETQGYVDKYPEIAKKYGLAVTPQKVATTDTNPADTNTSDKADGAADVNQSAGQTVVPSSDTQVAAADQVNPNVVTAELTKLGVKDSITPDQILALAGALGISEAESVAESAEFSDILRLAGVSEAVSPGSAYNWLRGIVGGGAKADAAAASTVSRAERPAGTSVLNRGSEETGTVFRQNGITWREQSNGTWIGKDKNGKELIRSAEEIGARRGKADGRMSPGGNKSGTAVDNPANIAAQRATNTVDDMVRGSVQSGADDAARAVVKGTADDAAAGVSKLVADAGKGQGLLYNIGKLGGRFARLVKNNKFLTLLAVLAGLGIYLATSDNTDPVKPQPGPNGPVGPNGPAENPEDKKREEERKRQLGELNELLKRLYGGWPTDAETAAAIQAGVAVGGTAPEGFKPGGGVATQPAVGSQGQTVADIGDATTKELINRGLLPGGSEFTSSNQRSPKA